MEELHRTAMAYFNFAPQNLKDLANEFFRSMDYNGDGQINLQEFISFMRDEGYHLHMGNASFFKKLDRNGNKCLDFQEVMTLLYIIKSGRQFCGGCGRFITGMYFTCVECFDRPYVTPFSVCPSCFHRSGAHHHMHRLFLDNFLLLEARKNNSGRPQLSRGQSLAATSTSYCDLFPEERGQTPVWRSRAGKALDILLLSANVGFTAATACTIM